MNAANIDADRIQTDKGRFQRKWFETLVFYLSALLVIVFEEANAQPAKILLKSEMFYNCSTKGDAWMLADEQQIAGDPAAHRGGAPTTVFFPGWPHQDIYYPADVIIDLGVNHRLDELWLFDANDSDTLSVLTGYPGNWLVAGKILLNEWNSWRQLPLRRVSRYVMLRFRSPSSRVAEIVLYGHAHGPVAPTPQATPHQRQKMQHFIGINGFVDDPVLRIKAVGSFREYHNWQWDEGNTVTSYAGYPHNQYAWNPSWVSGHGWGWNFDTFYTQLKSANVSVSPVLQGNAPFMTGFENNLIQHKPLRFARNALLPASYEEHADYMFQFAARYGKTQVPTRMLKLRHDQHPATGLGLTDYIENWNEPDKWWFGRGGYFHPFEFAAMCSADYDGHEGTMGPGKGMKNADPTIKMVMGGLASLNLEYVRCMKLWADNQRKTGFPADVINFHHYSNNGSHGISPEDDSLRQKLSLLVDWRNRYLPQKEIWLSEFGYDTNPESTIASRPVGNADAQEMQGRWLLRSLIAAAAAGIDRAHIFMLRDVNHPDPNTYNSSGLTSEIWYGHQPKKAWFYIKTFTHLMFNQMYVNDLNTTDPRILAYRFGNSTNDTITDLVWCSTSQDLKIGNHPHFLALPPGNWATLVYQLVDNDTVPLRLPLVRRNNTIYINLSELPLIIRHIRLQGGTSSINIPLRMGRLSEPKETLSSGNTLFAERLSKQCPDISAIRYRALWQSSLSFRHNYKNTSLLYPDFLNQLLRDCCSTCGHGETRSVQIALDRSFQAHSAPNPFVEIMPLIGKNFIITSSTNISNTNNSGNVKVADI